jgi:hypothetical protein
MNCRHLLESSSDCTTRFGVDSIACWFGIRLAISQLLFQPVFVLLALRSRLWLGLLNHRTDGGTVWANVCTARKVYDSSRHDEGPGALSVRAHELRVLLI